MENKHQGRLDYQLMAYMCEANHAVFLPNAILSPFVANLNGDDYVFNNMRVCSITMSKLAHHNAVRHWDKNDTFRHLAGFSIINHKSGFMIT